MKKTFFIKDAWVILIVFAVSRFISSLFDIRFEYAALFSYWQYLDVETLQNNLLNGVWYNHAQPPLFNLLIGGVLKTTGEQAALVFSILFKLITISNTLLLYGLIKKITGNRRIGLFIGLFYMLSPAAIVYETELFYTTFVSLLFLISFHFLLHLNVHTSWRSLIGFFLPLVLICFTRSMYHLLWLMVIFLILVVYFRKTAVFRKSIILSLAALLLTGSWYVKNYYLFGNFSTSSWIGMNLSRNVFHDNKVADSTKITFLDPFLPVSAYKKFVNDSATIKYRGLNDRDLLSAYKNDSLLNLNHVAYLEISDRYLQESKQFIKKHPVAFLKNVAQSSILFFTPATMYSVTKKQTVKLKYYDAVYSFNLSHFAGNKQERRLLLTISAIPRILLYGIVFFWLVQTSIRRRSISIINLLILITIGYVFTVSSLLEHYENMRFRFETEPLFLLLAAQAVVAFHSMRGKKTIDATSPDIYSGKF